MKNTNNYSNLHIGFISLVIVLLVIVVYIVIRSQSNLPSSSVTPTNPSQELPNNYRMKEYKSNFLKISLSINGDFQVEEKYNSIYLNNNEGEIIIGRIATNLSNLTSYLDDLSRKNKTQLTNQKSCFINNITCISGNIKTSNKIDKLYFFYVNNWVYSISTSSEALYDDLNQIAQSFHYTP